MRRTVSGPNCPFSFMHFATYLNANACQLCAQKSCYVSRVNVCVFRARHPAFFYTSQKVAVREGNTKRNAKLIFSKSYTGFFDNNYLFRLHSNRLNLDLQRLRVACVFCNAKYSVYLSNRQCHAMSDIVPVAGQVEL